ncbi:hypothetical protein GCM10023175_50470 [Pseudonocardia xishanensis]|uniref:Uncharacterized protein n=2 Tax=Pseudonocardia xishanensis TaxID=630995 RepID=A0ABP8RZV0_9PSEU
MTRPAFTKDCQFSLLYEATIEIPSDLPTEHIDKLLEEHTHERNLTANTTSQALGTWDVLNDTEAVST